jgi:NAD(P)-dependent dehydrogenase (short-subunit alcohol dehydrogenase family)
MPADTQASGSVIPQLFSVAGRTAVITGAGSGIGRTLARAFSQAGARVACVDVDAGSLEETFRSIETDALAVVADVSSAAEVERAAADVLEWSDGSADILVNNAGIAPAPGRLLDVPLEDWDRTLAINLRSLFLVTQALLPALVRSPNSSVVNISSYLGLVGVYPEFAATAVPYAASKAGVIGFTRQVAIEYAAEGVRVNAIAPGWHGGTNLGRERLAKGGRAAVKQLEAFIDDAVPLGFRGVPEDLVGLTIYLASDASRYVTGQVIAHDGGITAA